MLIDLFFFSQRKLRLTYILNLVFVNQIGDRFYVII